MLTLLCRIDHQMLRLEPLEPPLFREWTPEEDRLREEMNTAGDAGRNAEKLLREALLAVSEADIAYARVARLNLQAFAALTKLRAENRELRARLGEKGGGE